MASEGEGASALAAGPFCPTGAEGSLGACAILGGLGWILALTVLLGGGCTADVGLPGILYEKQLLPASPEHRACRMPRATGVPRAEKVGCTGQSLGLPRVTVAGCLWSPITPAISLMAAVITPG